MLTLIITLKILNMHFNYKRRYYKISQKNFTQQSPNNDIKQGFIQNMSRTQFNMLAYAIAGVITIGSVYFLREKLLFGTVAGIVAKTSTAPLERLVTYRQAKMLSSETIPQTIRHIYRTEGILGIQNFVIFLFTFFLIVFYFNLHRCW